MLILFLCLITTAQIIPMTRRYAYWISYSMYKSENHPPRRNYVDLPWSFEYVTNGYIIFGTILGFLLSIGWPITAPIYFACHSNNSMGRGFLLASKSERNQLKEQAHKKEVADYKVR